MKRCLLGLMGAVVLGGFVLFGELLSVDAAWPGLPCHGTNRNTEGESRCFRCESVMVPICQICYTMKKETKYKYCCVADTICIPSVTPLCEKGDCPPEGNCQGPKNCPGACCIRDVHKLVKFPVTREVPVRQCNLLWVCPRCNPLNIVGATGTAWGIPVESKPPKASPEQSVPEAKAR